MTLGEKIKSYRSSVGLTQLDFATRLNLTQASISQFENGHRLPDRQTLVHICKIFKVDSEVFLDDVENPRELVIRNLGNLSPSDLMHANDFIDLLKAANRNKCNTSLESNID